MEEEIEDFLADSEDLIDSFSKKNEEIPPDLITELISLVGEEYDG